MKSLILNELDNECAVVFGLRSRCVGQVFDTKDAEGRDVIELAMLLKQRKVSQLPRRASSELGVNRLQLI